MSADGKNTTIGYKRISQIEPNELNRTNILRTVLTECEMKNPVLSIENTEPHRLRLTALVGDSIKNGCFWNEFKIHDVQGMATVSYML